MGWSAYPIDTGFFSSLGTYDFDVRCEIAKELGFDATYLTRWSDHAWEDVPTKWYGDMARRIDCDVLAKMVAERRLTEDEVLALAEALAYSLAKQAHRL